MVNGVPREVPRPKPEGPPAPRVFGHGTSQEFLAIGPPDRHSKSIFFCAVKSLVLKFCARKSAKISLKIT